MRFFVSCLLACIPLLASGSEGQKIKSINKDLSLCIVNASGENDKKNVVLAGVKFRDETTVNSLNEFLNNQGILEEAVFLLDVILPRFTGVPDSGDSHDEPKFTN